MVGLETAFTIVITSALATASLVIFFLVLPLRSELARAKWAVDHDAMTGLSSRVAAQRRYETAVREGIPVTMALLDLDHLKVVNDTYGHPAGDALIKAIGNRLRTVCGAATVAARLGGDEFLLLVPSADVAEVEANIYAILSKLALPVLVETSRGDIVEVTPSASAGICISPWKPDAIWSTQLRQADIALYQAKRFQLGVATYHPQLEKIAGLPSDLPVMARA